MGISVYLADDHRILLDGLRALLARQEGISVIGEAEDGQQAVQDILEQRPDIAVMDITMPGLNGIDAAQKIKLHGFETRVIILSAFSDAEHVSHALRAGAQGYLIKTDIGAELVDAIHAVYHGKRFLSKKLAHMIVNHPDQLNASLFDVLSLREREVLQMVVEGHPSAVIAEKLEISPKTVETYRSRLMEKLGVENLPELVRLAIKHGLTPL